MSLVYRYPGYETIRTLRLFGKDDGRSICSFEDVINPYLQRGSTKVSDVESIRNATPTYFKSMMFTEHFGT